MHKRFLEGTLSLNQKRSGTNIFSSPLARKNEVPAFPKGPQGMFMHSNLRFLYTIIY